jgi:hypothetical protein
MGHLLRFEPHHVPRSPRNDLLRPTNIELKEKLSEPISVTKLVSFGGMTRSNKIPQSLLLGVGNPDCGQVTTAKEPCELVSFHDVGTPAG